MTNYSTITVGLVWSAAITTVIIPSPLEFAQAAPTKKNELKVKTCEGKSSRRCTVDPSSFNPKFLAGDVIDIDFGPGRRYKCNSKGRGGSSTCTASTSSSGGLFDGAPTVGDMNVITRGKNSRGEDYIFGSTSVGSEVCKFGPDAAEILTVECIPAAEYPREADAIEEVSFVGNDSVPSANHAGSSSSIHQHNHRGLVADDLGGNIDVMVVWTKKAECVKSGLAAGCNQTDITENNMRGLIDLAIAETNTAYNLSGVTTQLRLVHAYREPNYVEATTSAFSMALSSLRSTNDGIMDDVHEKRDIFGADIVAMIIDDSQYCGMAYLGPSSDLMFSVSSWNCATGYYTFGHEIGHNMGCNHDKGTTNACASSASNYGWRDPSGGFRSILAYNCATGQCDNITTTGCPRVQRFSNNAYLYNGKAMGSPQHDNASQINSVKSLIAAYRTVAVPTTSPQPTNSLTPPTTAATSPFASPGLTANPTQRPVTPIPSATPTKSLEPSASPTSNPTTSPTHVPSTITPTHTPTTINPTTTPTTTTITSSPEPSAIPTANPTTSPTHVPSTIAPTHAPITIYPTTTPTTISPSMTPTAAVRGMTSKPSTARPTTTITPTAGPSTRTPTAKPSTRTPTARPSTAIPTARPSTAKPTRKPTKKPVKKR